MMIAEALRNEAGQRDSQSFPPEAAGGGAALSRLAANGISGPDAATDQVRLAELGIGVTAIEQCEDADVLWRAVRELVLPQRVSEPIQQRILRRVWVVDPDIAKGSLLDFESE